MKQSFDSVSLDDEEFEALFNKVRHHDSYAELIKSAIIDHGPCGICALHDSYGNSLLDVLVFNNKMGVASLLLRNGADVDTVQGVYLTPLHQACKGGLETMVRLLVEDCKNMEDEDKCNWGWSDRELHSFHFISEADCSDYTYPLKFGADTALLQACV